MFLSWQVLVVLIRDFINYTHESLNVILEPAWKLLTIHLPIYLHSVCYERPLEGTSAGDSDSTYVSCPLTYIDAFDDDDPGIEGMIKQLIDLITTLIINPAIHTLIRAGLVPFTATLCSYLLLPQSELTAYHHHPSYFLEDVQERQGEMQGDQSESVRVVGTRVLETLIETFSNASVEALLAIALDHIVVQACRKKSLQPAPAVRPPAKGSKPAKAPAGKRVTEEAKRTVLDTVDIYEYIGEVYEHHEPWRRSELGLYLLSFLSDDLHIALDKGLKFADVSRLGEALQSVCARQNLFDTEGLLGRLLATASDTVELFPKTHPLLPTYGKIAAATLRRSNFAPSLRLVACKCLVCVATRIQALPVDDCGSIVRHMHQLQVHCALDNCRLTASGIGAAFLFGNPKLLTPLISELIPYYLGMYVASGEESHEFIELTRKICAQAAYVPSVILVYVPLLAKILGEYPKQLESGALKVP